METLIPKWTIFAGSYGMQPDTNTIKLTVQITSSWTLNTSHVPFFDIYKDSGNYVRYQAEARRAERIALSSEAKCIKKSKLKWFQS